MTSMIEERTFKKAVDYITTNLAKYFKPINSKATFLYLAVKKQHYYILNNDIQYTIIRTNHKLQNIDTTDFRIVWNYMMGTIYETPKGYFTEYGCILKNEPDTLFNYSVSTRKRTTEQKQITAQKKLAKVKIYRQDKIDRYRDLKLALFIKDKHLQSVKYSRNIHKDFSVSHLYLPYGIGHKYVREFSDGRWKNLYTTLHSDNVYVKDEDEFNSIIDDALNGYNKYGENNLMFQQCCECINYHYESGLSYKQMMKDLHRESIKNPYKNAIENVLVNNTKMNTDCVNAIMEWL